YYLTRSTGAVDGYLSEKPISLENPPVYKEKPHIAFFYLNFNLVMRKPLMQTIFMAQMTRFHGDRRPGFAFLSLLPIPFSWNAEKIIQNRVGFKTKVSLHI
ncbi:hypothetical protein ACJX0J_026203, partial [Zea mays]